ncbi:hypothetical protein SAMN04488038_10853 [Solimonas aquatica]|uniref:Lipoprotein n=1 Tax=Solimonas aquatica TaxID=489703 RepID=A0A1H9H7F4_9GAMM|nr:hypothetical protein [Solimonas aquatica]SEQ58246.1 hypothetical protein SAMN04488038_10853 [Solimonas aquatica]
MPQLTGRGFLLLAALLLGACDANLHEPLRLRPQAQPYVQHSDLLLSLQTPQTEARASAAPGSADWFKRLLYGPLHDYGEAAAPAVTTAPPPAAGVDVAPLLVDALREQLQAIAWLHLESSAVFASDAPPAPEAGRSTFWTQAQIEFSADAASLQLRLRCALTPPRRADNHEVAQAFSLAQQYADAAYRADLAYTLRLPQASRKREDNLALWQQQGALRELLSAPAAQLAQTLAQDLRGELPSRGVRKELVEGEYAPLLVEQGQARLFRLEDGSLRWYEQLDRKN